MNGDQFISLAGKLAALPAGDEASYRSAVSRAYYGAFHVARAFLNTLGFASVANANVHAFVRQHLFGSNDPDACSAASQLGDLQSARNRADYRLDDADVGTKEYAVLSVERAHSVVSAIARCQEGGKADAIRLAIAHYLQQIRPR